MSVYSKKDIQDLLLPLAKTDDSKTSLSEIIDKVDSYCSPEFSDKHMGKMLRAAAEMKALEALREKNPSMGVEVFDIVPDYKDLELSLDGLSITTTNKDDVVEITHENEEVVRKSLYILLIYFGHTLPLNDK